MIFPARTGNDFWYLLEYQEKLWHFSGHFPAARPKNWSDRNNVEFYVLPTMKFFNSKISFPLALRSFGSFVPSLLSSDCFKTQSPSFLFVPADRTTNEKWAPNQWVLWSEWKRSASPWSTLVPRQCWYVESCSATMKTTVAMTELLFIVYIFSHILTF